MSKAPVDIDPIRALDHLCQDGAGAVMPKRRSGKCIVIGFDDYISVVAHGDKIAYVFACIRIFRQHPGQLKGQPFLAFKAPVITFVKIKAAGGLRIADDDERHAAGRALTGEYAQRRIDRLRDRRHDERTVCVHDTISFSPPGRPE